MKVVHVTYSKTHGGAGILCSDLSNSLNQIEGVSSVVYSIQENFDFYTRIANVISQRLISIMPMSNIVSYNSLNIFPSVHVSKINLIDADIVHIHWPNGEMIPIYDFKKINKPIIWTLHDNWVFNLTSHHPVRTNNQFKFDYENSKVRQFIFNTFKLAQLKKCKNIRFIAPSKWSHQIFNHSLLSSFFECNLIHNGIDLSVFQPDCNQNNKSIKKIAFGAFSFDKNKNIEESVKLLKEKFIGKDDIEIYTFGLNEIDIPGTINKGMMDRLTLSKFLRTLDCIVIPSNIESFGLLAAEAIASNCPVVCYYGTGLDDIVTHKVNGYSCNFNDIDDLLEGVDFCLEFLGNKNIFSTVSLFNMVEMTKNYIAEYKKIISGN